MSISIEAIIAILALLVALPPAILIVKHWLLRRQIQRNAHEIHLDPMEPPAFLASSPQPSSPRYAASRTGSIRMIIENGPERHCLEITRDQHHREVVGPGPGVSLLSDAQAVGQVNSSQNPRTTEHLP
ncbi:hypothetical protein F5Y14DRAFT_412736 [Nemania sp. NC0429]|nr:hypothetical protein F5Y14DRAFT_412736 [Nemania sp. NC0429]